MSSVLVTQGSTVRQGDTAPALLATLLDDAGNAVNLTGFTVQFLMRNQLTKASVIAAGTVTLVSAANGQVSYAWQSADTANAGNFEGEFRITAIGPLESFPNNKFILVVIVPSI